MFVVITGQDADNHLTVPTEARLDRANHELGGDTNNLLVSAIHLQHVAGFCGLVLRIVGVQQIAAAGYNPKTGVDLTLLQQARATGKPVHGFETIDQEMQKLAPADDAEDMAALRSAITDSATSAQDIADLFQAWADGDEKRLTSFMVDKMKAESPSLYRRVIVERDAAWTPQIERLVRDLKAQGGGTAFVTVGVGHLVGPDSLIAMLRADGAKVKQVE